MTTLYVAMALGVIAAAGVLLAVWSLRPSPPSAADVLERRVMAYEATLPPSTDIELQVPFVDRIIRPAIRRLSHVLEQTMPAKAQQSIQRRLAMAGRPSNLTATDFITWRYVLTALLCVLGIAIGALTHRPELIALGSLMGAATGLYAPILWLRYKVSRRKQEIEAQLPDVIDALIICVEAGLTFDGALQKVVEKYDYALSEELARVLQEVRLGRPRLEALSDMATRAGVEELNSFVQAVIQSEQLGAGIVRILRIQADEMRQRRLTLAQERGGRASLKMLLPMVGCIFPTLWIILLGPAALVAMRALTGR